MIQGSGEMTGTSVSEKSSVLEASTIELSLNFRNNVDILVGSGMPWKEKFREKMFRKSTLMGF